VNLLRTGLLLAALTALFGTVGLLAGGEAGMILALLFAGLGNLFAWWNSDRLVLAWHRARPVTPESHPGLHRLVAELAARAGIPTPRVYLIESPQPNAFATGRDPRHAAVAVTTGLLELLDREELAGVIAHELAHIRHRDTLTMTVAATLAGAVSALANLFFWFGGILGGERRDHPLGLVGTLLLLFLAPLAATLIQLAISRTREFAADAAGAEICGQPLWLARALEKIEAHARAAPLPTAELHPETAPLFIVNPLAGEGGIAALFRTHPPTGERIRRLRELARRMRLAPPRPLPTHHAPARPRRFGSVPPTRRG